MHAVRRGPMKRARIIVLAVIFSLLAGTGFSIADEGSAPEPAPTAGPVHWPGPVSWPGPTSWPGPVPWADPVPWPGPVPWPVPILHTGFFGRTMDKTHAMIERNIIKQAVQF